MADKENEGTSTPQGAAETLADTRVAQDVALTAPETEEKSEDVHLDSSTAPEKGPDDTLTAPEDEGQSEDINGDTLMAPENEGQSENITSNDTLTAPEIEDKSEGTPRADGDTLSAPESGEGEVAIAPPADGDIQKAPQTVQVATSIAIETSKGTSMVTVEASLVPKAGGGTSTIQLEATIALDSGETVEVETSIAVETTPPKAPKKALEAQLETQSYIAGRDTPPPEIKIVAHDDDMLDAEDVCIDEPPLEEGLGASPADGAESVTTESVPWTTALPAESSGTSQLETASPNDAVLTDDQEQCFHHPLSLHWCFGYNLELPVHNISEGNRKMIFYVCAHTGVLFDCINNRQCLLQGHNNPISCSAVSKDRRWLATADSGSDCVLIVWDSFTGIPVRTIFDGAGGVVVIAMSPDSQYMATISASKLQVVSIWEWTNDSSAPLCQASLGEDYSYQTHLAFHDDDPHQLVSNSEDLVVFYYWKDNEIKFHSHPVLDKDFNRTIGRFHQSVFVPGSTLALTGTSEGHSIVWQNEVGDDADGPHVKKGVKLMRMHDSPITVMTSTLDMVVTGDTEGKIKFFDSELKMVNWYEDTTKYGPLCSISFSHFPTISLIKSSVAAGKSVSDFEEHSYPPESTKAATPFVVPDYAISTTSASIIYFSTSSSTAEIVVNEHDASVTALAAHPFLPHLVTTGYACRMKLWDYDKKLVLAMRDFGEPNFMQCVCFDPKGEFLSVGFTDGTLQVLDAITLANACPPFRYSRDAVTKLSFSHDSAFMATADLDKCVCVYVAQPADTQKPWRFLAKYRSHFKKIADLMFGVKLDSNIPRLLSLGADRILVEYDLINTTQGKMSLLSADRIEQSAIPMAMAWYPPVTTESFLLLANNQFKIKLYNSTTKMCRQTLLGPTFGSPLKKVIVLPAPILYGAENQEVRRYMAYCTKNKVGLLLLPHDGNPHNSKCLMAHPGKVADMTCSFDGKYIFTAGGEDCSVNMWSIHTDALEAVSLLGGEELQPFYSMLDGGRDGEFFTELEEYFYYAQIRSQGPDITSVRNVSTTILIEEIPNIMRALGFYPSEQEIEDMINEVKFSSFVDTGSYVTTIDLGDFIKLYINHRPVFGLSPLQIGHAFKVLGDKQEGEDYWSVDRNSLLLMLQGKGEHFTEAEVVEYLMTLLGHSENPEVDGVFTAEVVPALEEIPEKITAPLFAEEIIGLSTQQ